MHVRQRRPEDVSVAVELWRTVRADSGRRPGRAEVDQVRQELAAVEKVCVVLVDADRVLGFALGDWRARGFRAGQTPPPAADGELTTDVLHVLTVVVDASIRRQGRGAGLLEGLADAAYPRGARRLSAYSEGPADEAFLQSTGFSTDSRDGHGRHPSRSRLWLAELDPPRHEITVGPGIRLGQLLKHAGVVQTGAQAKALLAAGGVTVNDDVELRRGRQLCSGDTVGALDRAVRIVMLAPVAPD